MARFSQMFGAIMRVSDIVSVIGAAKLENRSERTKANERMGRRQIADSKRVVPNQAFLCDFRKAAAVNPCLPANFDPRVRHLT